MTYLITLGNSARWAIVLASGPSPGETASALVHLPVISIREIGPGETDPWISATGQGAPPVLAQ